jgi:hypothetical protein
VNRHQRRATVASFRHEAAHGLLTFLINADALLDHEPLFSRAARRRRHTPASDPAVPRSGTIMSTIVPVAMSDRARTLFLPVSRAADEPLSWPKAEPPASW